MLVAARVDMPAEELAAALLAELDADPDPVLASLRRARLRPPPSAGERDRDRVLVAEALNDSRPWMTTEEILAKVDAMRPRAAE
jgi:hypothetical protein